MEIDTQTESTLKKQNPPPSRLVLVGEKDQDPLKTETKNKTRNNLFIATLNVRSLRTPEKLIELEEATKYLKWDIIGEIAGMYGVGFLVKKKLARGIEEIKGVTERIAILNIKLPLQNEKYSMWSKIQAYSPTESCRKDDVAKIDIFYKDLQDVLETSHKNIVLMGDFSGQIGQRHLGEQYTVGEHGMEKKTVISDKTKELLDERKTLLLNKKDNKKKITELSKKINERIGKDRKVRRETTLTKYIETNGGVKKAFKELNNKKDWMSSFKKMNGNLTSKRPDILRIATDYYRKLYSSNQNAKRDRCFEDFTITEPVPSILQKEVTNAIKSQKLEKAPGPDQITNELLKTISPVDHKPYNNTTPDRYF
ncbi:uncharacterized protein LOC126978958 [Leptidea sinapis]|uniref:uncharacterized protein LOC126978958 n=1 Tax=Leptidea sinapis TaxID=189913 RepID=UPI0021C37C4B|nr:uncharacterized protein LOC126978958 [Leptidea sinapis]